MAASYSKRFGFLHIPKTGGTTLLNHFQEYVCDLIIDPVLLHSSFSDAYKAMDKNHNLRWFALVRNPYDRIYSAFAFLQTYYPSSEWSTFKEMLVHAKRNIEDNVLLRPMTFFVHKQDLARYDVSILRYESFDKSVSKIASYLDIPNTIKKNFRVNYTVEECSIDHGLKYGHIYAKDNELLSLVNNIYAEDFKTFQYPIVTSLK